MPSYTSHGRGACETEPAPFCLIACRVLDVPVPEIVLQRAGNAPMVEELITVAMPQLMRSVAARDDADPEHEAVIGTVIVRQSAVLNFPASNSSSSRSGLNSAVMTRTGGVCIPPCRAQPTPAQTARQGFKVPQTRSECCGNWPENRISHGRCRFWALLERRVDMTSHALI